MDSQVSQGVKDSMEKAGQLPASKPSTAIPVGSSDLGWKFMTLDDLKTRPPFKQVGWGRVGSIFVVVMFFWWKNLPGWWTKKSSFIWIRYERWVVWLTVKLNSGSQEVSVRVSSQWLQAMKAKVSFTEVALVLSIIAFTHLIPDAPWIS